MSKWQDLLDVCSMAEASLETECSRCQQRYRNGKILAQQLRERKDAGQEKIDIDEAINLILTVAS